MVDDLSKISQGKYTSDVTVTPREESAMKMLALACLVSVMKSLAKWSDLKVYCT